MIPVVHPIIDYNKIVKKLDGFLSARYLSTNRVLQDSNNLKYVDGLTMPELSNLGLFYAWSVVREKDYYLHPRYSVICDDDAWNYFMTAVRALIEGQYETVTAFHIAYEYFETACRGLRSTILGSLSAKDDQPLQN